MNTIGEHDVSMFSPDEILSRLKVLHPKFRARAEYSFRQLNMAQKKRIWMQAAQTENIEAMKFFIKLGEEFQLINCIVEQQKEHPSVTCGAAQGLLRQTLAGSSPLTAPLSGTALSCAAYFGAEDTVAFLLSCPEIEPNAGLSLIQAAAQGHSRILRLLLMHENIDVNAVDENGRSALSFAAFRGNIVILDMLLTHPRIDPSCGAPLVNAIFARHPEVINRLLNVQRIGINTSIGSVTALSCAAGIGNAELVQRLLGMADIDPNRGCALKSAASIGNLDIVNILLGAPGLDVNLADEFGEAALASAAFFGQENVLSCLLGVPQININACNFSGLSALSRAAYAGNGNIVRLLLKNENIDPNLGAPLVQAAKNGHWGIVELLLGHPSIDVNVGADGHDGNTLLSIAVECGAMALISRLLRLTTINPNAGAPLAAAACRGRLAVVKRLLHHPAVDVNAGDSVGQSALLIAAAKGDHRMSQLLLQVNDIDVNRANHAGQTPLSRAAHYGRVETVAVLLAFPGIDCERGWPLIWAAGEGHDIVVNMLLHHRADINVRDDNGNTALISAVTRANSGVAKRLLQEKNIQVNARNLAGKTALSQAVSAGNVELVSLLVGHPDIDPNIGYPLLEAASLGHWHIVRKFLDLRNLDVNVAKLNGESALCMACSAGNAAAVRMLLRVPAIDVYQGWPLVQAASGGYLQVVQMLLSDPSTYLGLAIKQVKAALSVAAGKEHWSIVNLLTEYRAKLV